MKGQRDTDKEPAKYAVGDRVYIQKEYYQKGFEPQSYYYYYGTIEAVGISSYNIAYDWYVIKLDNGDVIELWWMTGYKILYKVSQEQSGLPSQEA